MITPKDLEKDEIDVRNREKTEEEEAKKRKEEWDKEYEIDCLNKVKEILATDSLGKLILEANRKGYIQLNIWCYKVYYVDPNRTYWPNYEWYQCPFKLDFSPNPNAKYTKRLVNALKRAGYRVKVITESVEDLTWTEAGDGGFEGLGTYHNEYYIEIKWK